MIYTIYVLCYIYHWQAIMGGPPVDSQISGLANDPGLLASLPTHPPNLSPGILLCGPYALTFDAPNMTLSF